MVKNFYRLDNGELLPMPQNGIRDGVAVSNLDKYFSDNIDAANAAGWYELADVAPPAYDAETQTLAVAYAVVDNKIVPTYTVTEISTQ